VTSGASIDQPFGFDKRSDAKFAASALPMKHRQRAWQKGGGDGIFRERGDAVLRRTVGIC